MVRAIKWRRMRWAGHVARVGERRGVHRVWWGNLRERDYLEDPGVDERIFRQGGVGACTRLIWLSIRTGGGHL
jgi:hypothetical protein